MWERVRYVDEKTFNERNRRMAPQPGDVLFSREGALLGVAVTVPEGVELCLGQRMMIFRLGTGIVPRYFEVVLNSPPFKAYYQKQIAGTASPHLNIGDIREFPIPLPAISEQERIVSEVESAQSIADIIDQTIVADLARAERLRQGVLGKAFRGELV